MLNSEFYSLKVNKVAYLMYQELSKEDKLKIGILLESEFIYLVQCLTTKIQKNCFTFGYELLRKENR